MPPLIMPAMDFEAGAIATAALLVVAVVFSIRAGLRGLRQSRKLTFYRLRRQQEARSWRYLVFAIVLLALALVIPTAGLSAVFTYFPPTATPTPKVASPTPSPSRTPAIAAGATIQPSIPVFTFTPPGTPTPHVPPAIVALFSSSVTPPAEIAFSTVVFTQSGFAYPPKDTAEVFKNPLRHMWGIFSYDGMAPGVQWTALWWRAGELVYQETAPWNGGTGGAGYTDWNPSPEYWRAGNYEVQIFVGENYETSGRFTVEGAVPMGLSTATPRAGATRPGAATSTP